MLRLHDRGRTAARCRLHGMRRNIRRQPLHFVGRE